MPLHPLLLRLLVCPACRGELTVPQDAPELADPPELQCARCGLGYPVVDGIPVMLPARARRLEAPPQGAAARSRGP